MLSSSVGSSWLIAALFQDATANALAAQQQFSFTAISAVQLVIGWEMLAGVTVSTTIKIRGGGNNAGTTTFNGSSGGRFYGGSLASFLRVEEIAT
jgi:hypothetical protein